MCLPVSTPLTTSDWTKHIEWSLDMTRHAVVCADHSYIADWKPPKLLYMACLNFIVSLLSSSAFGGWFLLPISGCP